MFNLFKKKQNEVEIPQVQPMAAWEENSYMHVLSKCVRIHMVSKLLLLHT